MEVLASSPRLSRSLAAERKSAWVGDSAESEASVDLVGPINASARSAISVVLASFEYTEYPRAEATSWMHWSVYPRMHLRNGLVGLLALVLQSCGFGPSITPLSISLPTWGPQVGTGCAFADLDGWTLQGAAGDPQVAWIENPTGRRELLWPLGFTAVFDPYLEVRDRSGETVARAGDSLAGGCWAEEGIVLTDPGSFE